MNNNTLSSSIYGEELAIILKFAAASDRPQLNKIAVYADGALGSSDGHVGIMRVPSEGAPPTAERSLLATIDADQARRLRIGGKHEVHIEHNGALTVSPIGMLHPDPHPEFPNLWKVFPGAGRKTRLPNGCIGFDARIMGSVMSAIGKIGARKSQRHIAFHIGDPLGPMMARWTTETASWHVAIMPSRI